MLGQVYRYSAVLVKTQGLMKASVHFSSLQQSSENPLNYEVKNLKY